MGTKNKDNQELLPVHGDWTREVQHIFEDLYKIILDSNNYYYGVTRDDIITQLDDIMMKSKKVAAIESEANVEKKGLVFDQVLEHFILGSRGHISKWDIEQNTNSTLVIRGVGTSARNAVKHCWNTGRQFYYVDTGYFGNEKIKYYHRVTKNNLQNLGPIIKRPLDRIRKTGWRYRNFTPGEKILICPPSEKVMMLFDQDLDTWLNSTIETIKKYTDRPIEIRLKPTRAERTSTDTLEQALSENVHCLVTYNSIAATEAIMAGKPAFTLGPNAAHILSLSDLSKIETPRIPAREEVEDFAAHLSYCQFTLEEMKNGYAWSIVNENYSLSERDSSIE